MIRKRVLFLTNTAAGQGTAMHKLYPIIETLAENGCEATVYPILPEKELTSDAIIGDILETAQAAAAAGTGQIGKSSRGGVFFPFDVILCCGGDGTLNHLINCMMDRGLNRQVPIAYIPSGTTNDFSKNLNGDLTAEDICRCIAQGHTFAYDIGWLGETTEQKGCYFNYVAGFGAFTKISYTTSQAFKNIFGYGAYILNMIATLPRNMSYKRHVIVEHDGRQEEDDYIFGGVTNSLSLAGVESPILGNAELNDGLLEVLLIKAPEDIQEIRQIVNTISHGSTNNQYVKVIHTSHAAFLAEEPLDWTLDGEFGGSFQHTVINTCPRAVRIVVQ